MTPCKPAVSLEHRFLPSRCRCPRSRLRQRSPRQYLLPVPLLQLLLLLPVTHRLYATCERRVPLGFAETPRRSACTPSQEELKSARELSNVSSQFVLKCLYLARIGRPDILCSVNKLARSIKKWTKACDQRLSRLIPYIHPTSEYKQHRYVGNTAKLCKLGLFQDSDFAGDLEDSTSTSGATLCVFGSHAFVPISWMCKKLLCLFNISHFSSTDCSEVMSKRTQKDSGEERVTAKSKPMMNLVSRRSERTPDVLPPTASESPGKTRHESQFPLSSRTEQHHRTGRPVVNASSSSYSERNVEKTWFFSRVEI